MAGVDSESRHTAGELQRKIKVKHVKHRSTLVVLINSNLPFKLRLTLKYLANISISSVL